MINLYVYEKNSRHFKRSDIGLPEYVTDDLDEDEGFTLTPPPTFSRDWVWNEDGWVKPNISPERKRELQDEVWGAIKRHRQYTLESGVLLPSIGKVFQTDQNSMTQYANIASMIALDNYTPVQWKTFDNTWVTLTVELFKELQRAIRQRTDRVFAIAEEHKAKLMESDNPEDYDYTVGWIEPISENKETQ